MTKPLKNTKATKKKATPRRRSKKEKIVSYTRKYGGELAFEGIERQIYCWIRKVRIECAVHKSLYYEYNTHVIEDKQYDYLEELLFSVENKHTDIAKAVTEEGYLSPNDYVGAISDITNSIKARKIYDSWVVSGRRPSGIPYLDKEHTVDVLYKTAMSYIVKYPI